MKNMDNFLNQCEEKINITLKSLFWSFDLHFKTVRKWIGEDFEKQTMNNCELEQFIKICDNRLKLFKAFLNDLAIVLGFDFIALSILATLSSGKDAIKLQDIFFFQSGDIVLSILAWFLIAILISLFYSMFQCRHLIYLWTIFKEEALLKLKTE